VSLRRLLVLALLLVVGARAEAQARREVPAPGEAKPRRTAPSKPGSAAQGKTRRKLSAKGKRPRRVTPPPAPPGAASAQAAAARAAADSVRAAGVPGSELSVTLITFGVGPEVWERFGHNALWIHDDRIGSDVAYNWGLFDFEQPDFLRHFLTGDTKYWMAGEDAIRMLAAYHDIGRQITLQRLNVTPAQAAALRELVQANALEENKYYRYDYFRDNCSTRLRDALDRALDGALRQATDTMQTPLTYRSESLRLTEGDGPVQAGIDVALGRPADVPISAWESFFIPMRLRDAVRRVRVPAPDGTTIPLVADERTIEPSSSTPRVAEAKEPPDLVMRYLTVGVVLALVMILLRVMMFSHRGAAWGLALLAALWSLLCGALGLVLLYAWLGTKHVFWAWNESLLLLSPLSLLMVVLVFTAFLASRAVKRARLLSGLIAILGIGALVLALLPGGQSNLAIVALFLPVHVAVAAALALPLPEPAPPEKKR
jgi:hypothetical protein